MKREFIFILILLFLFISVYGTESPYVPGELLIQLKNNVDNALETLSEDFNYISLKPVKLLSCRMNIWLFEYKSGIQRDEEVLINVKKHSLVQEAQFNHYVEEREIFPDDPSFDLQWGLHNTGQTGGLFDADVDAPEAWDITTGCVTVLGDTLIVAIIDGGCDLNHDDLSLWKNYEEIPGNGIDDDENGYIDDYDGWNAYNSTGYIPSHSHGTHVSGIAAAIGNNTLGVSGVNWNAKVMPIAGSSGTESIVVEAYGYVLEMRSIYNETNGEHGAFVVATNASFGVNYGNPANFPLWCAIYDSLGVAGILSTGATMNISVNVDEVGDMPTACDSDYLITVTNTTSTDEKNSSAAWGLVTIDLGAPGTSIYSTNYYNSYSYKTGTSMSTPHVTGVIALLFSAASEELLEQYQQEPAEVALLMKEYILDGVDVIAALDGITVSGGRLNLYNSLQLMLNSSSNDEQMQTTPFVLRNYPNPFKPSGAGRSPATTISFSLAKDAKDTETCLPWRIEIYNIKGQKIKTLDCGESLATTADGVGYSISWDGTDENKQPVSTGIYLYQLQIDGKPVATKKMLLMK